MNPANHRALERAKLLQSALRRRGDWERWQEKAMRIAATPARTAEERIEKRRALAALEETMPREGVRRATGD